MIIDFKKLHVLIVDDVKAVRTVLSKSLNELGIEKIEFADSVLHAWEIIDDSRQKKKSPIDVVFCDWNMPNGDGIELLKRLRASEEKDLKYLKFIMVTGAKDKIIDAMESGAHNVIHKPFCKEKIKSKLELLFC